MLPHLSRCSSFLLSFPSASFLSFRIIVKYQSTPLITMTSNMASINKSDVKKTAKVQLPIEIMTKIAQHVADLEDLRSLGRLQRTSRDLYLIATPFLYAELGSSLQEIMDQLGLLRRLTPLQMFYELDDFEDIEATGVHPIDCTLTSRLIWTYSKVKVIVSRPTDKVYVGWADRDVLKLAMENLQDLKSQATKEEAKLFSSLEGIAIDNLKTPPGQSTPWGEMYFEVDRSFEWSPQRPDRVTAAVKVVDLFTGVVPRTHVCLNLEPTSFRFEVNELLDKLHCKSVILHQLTGKDFFEFIPLTDNLILDIHPFYSTPKARLGLCLELIGQIEQFLDPKRPFTFRIKREDWACEENLHHKNSETSEKKSQDNNQGREGDPSDITDGITDEKEEINEEEICWIDEAEFEEAMDKTVNSIDPELGPIDVKWGYLEGQEGRVKGCELCTSKSAT